MAVLVLNRVIEGIPIDKDDQRDNIIIVTKWTFMFTSVQVFLFSLTRININGRTTIYISKMIVSKDGEIQWNITTL